MPKPKIENVSDTALLVAVYRDAESRRPDALFRDPYAGLLADERAKRMATMARGFRSRYAGWSVALRTYIIDAYIYELIKEGIDTVINLGAGLDTRPYRLDLPASMRWIEVDFPQIVDLKNQKLAHEQPKCQLERVKMDLSNDAARHEFLAKVGSESRKALILTEGVIPYLSPEQVGALADDLHGQPNFRYWIADYFAPEAMKLLLNRKAAKQMQNAPLRFIPKDWFGFFDRHGWKPHEMRYIYDESVKVGRPIPLPWWARILRLVYPSKVPGKAKKFLAYALLEPT